MGRQQLAINAYQQAHKAMEGDEQKDEVLNILIWLMPTMLPKLETKIVQETDNHQQLHYLLIYLHHQNKSPEDSRRY